MTKELKPLYKEYEPNSKHPKANADISDDINAFKDCGRLLRKNEVVIDIDCLSKDQIRTLLSTFNISTMSVWTDRGVHLYFNRPESLQRAKNGVCALGFKIEMKTQTNSPHGLTIKRNGKAREIENPDRLQELPWFFHDKKQYKSLVGMTEGDGRNNALLVHRQKLGDREGWKEILNFINTTIFDTPLPPQEFATITRTMEINSTTNDEAYDMAEVVMDELKTVNWMGRTWWFDGSEYITDNKNQRLKQRIYRKAKGKNTRFIDEVLKQVEYRSSIFSDNEEFAIKFNNGVLLPTGEFSETEYTEFTPYHVDINYYPDAKPVPIVDQYITNLTGGDEDYRNLLLECLGFSFITNRERIRSLGKFFFFRGQGRNGKGTLLEIIRRILNPKNCTSLKISQLIDHTYAVTMVGKLANLGDDINGNAIRPEPMEVLKNISTCDTTSIRRMYQEGEDVCITAKLYFTTNEDIKTVADKGYAYKRRVMWMPMFNTVEKPDPKFITKITTTEALEYWVRLFMEGYQRLLQNGEWTSSERVNEYNELYHRANNIMLQFIEEHDPDTDFYGKSLTEIHTLFDEWAREFDDEAKWSKKNFKATLWNVHKMGYVKSRMNTPNIKGRQNTPRWQFIYQDEIDKDISPK